MATFRQTAHHLLEWYTTRARPFLSRQTADPHTLDAIDRQGQRLDAIAERAEEDVAVCFLGNSGVGKSTLLNAVVDQKYNVLPQGGIGPLTAQATIVRFAEKPFFRAAYLSARHVNSVRFILERAHSLAERATDRPSPLDDSLDEEARKEAEAALPMVATDGSIDGPTDKLEAYQRQARLMIQGTQQGDIDLPYLIDALRSVLGSEPRFAKTLSDDDVRRASRIRECLALARDAGVHHERHATPDDMPTFVRELKDHASGFLAPLIRTLEVGWTADVLRDGLVLADLPGVGVLSDEYRRVTAEWIRSKARAVVLVVDKSGVTDVSVDLLKNTGFFNNLLHDSGDPTSDPITLAVAVVKVDSSANDAWSEEETLNPDGARPWVQHFDEQCAKSIELITRQIRQALEKLKLEGTDMSREGRAEAIEHVLVRLQVFPISAPEYRRYYAANRKQPAQIDAAEQSRIPLFGEALRTLAVEQRGRTHARAKAAIGEFAELVRSSLAVVQAQWERLDRADEEARQLDLELREFLEKPKRELDHRRGAFRNFLRVTMPKEIELRVTLAANEAAADIRKYLRKLGELHWATLRAAVRRGGSYDPRNGKRVDIPNELALKFEEPVAFVWANSTLKELRRETKELGDVYVDRVGELVEWARARETRVQPQLVEALHDQLKAQTKELASVGKEAVDELKKAVRDELYKELEAKIRRKCEVFVERGLDEGSGVKRRMLDDLLREDLADAVLKTARPLAIKVLLENYHPVEEQVREHFGEQRDPLGAAREAIVDAHGTSIRRADKARRGRVLSEVTSVLDAMPKVSV